jgi:hypothetical protein
VFAAVFFSHRQRVVELCGGGQTSCLVGASSWRKGEVANTVLVDFATSCLVFCRFLHVVSVSDVAVRDVGPYF